MKGKCCDAEAHRVCHWTGEHSSLIQVDLKQCAGWGSVNSGCRNTGSRWKRRKSCEQNKVRDFDYLKGNVSLYLYSVIPIITIMIMDDNNSLVSFWQLKPFETVYMWRGGGTFCCSRNTTAVEKDIHSKWFSFGRTEMKRITHSILLNPLANPLIK